MYCARIKDTIQQ